MTLKERLLASIENHGKSDITGIYLLYPTEKKNGYFTNIVHLKK